MSDEPKISQRYRELPREEPPRALDEAILAASRRAVRARPGGGRWYFPLAAAAVVVLVVAVATQVEREQPDSVPVTLKPTPLPEPERAATAEERRAAPPQPFRSAPPPAARRDAGGAPMAAQAPTPAAASGARDSREFRAESRMASASVAQTPEAELERIARLRAAGRHEEADKALAEFRRRHPDYRIAPAMLERVEKK